MKVPTYQRESGRPSGVAGQRMSVQASPSAASAGARAAQQFFDQATDTSLSWYEKELTNRRRVQKRKADIAAEEEIIAAAQQAQQTDPNEAETYFDTEVERIKRTYGEQFENDFLRQNFELDFDNRAISKRVAVRANASERRIGDALATYEIQEQQLQNRIINAETQFDRDVAQYDLDRMYDEIEELGYQTKGDMDRRRVSSNQFVTKESYIARINAARSVEEQQAIIDELNEFGNLLPSTVAALVNKSEAEIAEIASAENKQKALEDALAKEVSAEQREQLFLEIRRMTPRQIKAYYDYALTEEGQEELRATLTISDRQQVLNFAEARASRTDAARQGQISRLSTSMDNVEDLLAVGILPDKTTMDNIGKGITYNGHEPSTRRFNDLIEGVETTRVMRAMSPAQAEKYEDDLRSRLDAEQDIDRKASLARQVGIVSKYRTNYDKSIQTGNHLEFFSNSEQISLPEFDFSNIAQSIEQRRSAMSEAGDILIQGMKFPEGQTPPFGALTRRMNAFTPAEAQKFGRLVAGLTPAQKVNLATELQPMAKFAPQMWEQLAKGNAKIFALAGALNEPQVAEDILIGESLIEAKTVDRPTENEYLAIFQDYVQDVYRLQGSLAENEGIVLEGMLNHYAATRTDRIEFKESEFRASMEAVTGGIGEYNGFKLELPRGVDQDQFDSWIGNITPGLLQSIVPDGFAGHTFEQAAETIKSSRLRSVANSSYRPVFGPNNMDALYNADGTPFTLQWTENVERLIRDAELRAREEQRQTDPFGFVEEPQPVEFSEDFKLSPDDRLSEFLLPEISGKGVGR